jgi:hypothetical protein
MSKRPRRSVARRAPMALALLAMCTMFGAGCAGPRMDSARYGGNAALYGVNPKCATEFSPCQDGTGK